MPSQASQASQEEPGAQGRSRSPPADRPPALPRSSFNVSEQNALRRLVRDFIDSGDLRIEEQASRFPQDSEHAASTRHLRASTTAGVYELAAPGPSAYRRDDMEVDPRGILIPLSTPSHPDTPSLPPTPTLLHRLSTHPFRATSLSNRLGPGERTPHQRQIDEMEDRLRYIGEAIDGMSAELDDMLGELRSTNRALRRELFLSTPPEGAESGVNNGGPIDITAQVQALYRSHLVSGRNGRDETIGEETSATTTTLLGTRRRAEEPPAQDTRDAVRRWRDVRDVPFPATPIVRSSSGRWGDFSDDEIEDLELDRALDRWTRRNRQRTLSVLPPLDLPSTPPLRPLHFSFPFTETETAEMTRPRSRIFPYVVGGRERSSGARTTRLSSVMRAQRRNAERTLANNPDLDVFDHSFAASLQLPAVYDGNGNPTGIGSGATVETESEPKPEGECPGDKEGKNKKGKLLNCLELTTGHCYAVRTGLVWRCLYCRRVL